MMASDKNFLLSAGLICALAAMPMVAGSQPQGPPPGREDRRPALDSPTAKTEGEQPRWQGERGSADPFAGWRLMRLMRESRDRAEELHAEGRWLEKWEERLAQADENGEEISERRRRIHELRSELLVLEREEFVDEFRARMDRILGMMDEQSERYAEPFRHRSGSGEEAPRVVVIRNVREAFQQLHDAATDFDSLHEKLTRPPDLSKLVPEPHPAARKGWRVERIEREISLLRKRLGHLTEELERVAEEEEESTDRWPRGGRSFDPEE